MKILEELQKQLEMQEMLKRTAESSLHLLKSKLEGKKFELLKMKDPKAAALMQNSQQQMNFLASEKLAVSKKQRGEGTRRGSMDVEPKTPEVSKVKKKKTKRNKSSSPKRKR
jgi:hypothetical protein